MRKNKVTLSLSPLALLTLAACGGGSTSGSSGFSASSGKVEDGPLQNAIAFLDYNDNGILDAGEPSERTGVDGSYSLTPTQANYSIVAVTDETTFDTISQSFVPGITLKAPSNSSMVTPTTTLMEDGGLTAGGVMAGLGLAGGKDAFAFMVLGCISERKGTGKKETITITNDKGRLTKEEIDQMIKDSEKFAEEDKAIKEKIDAKNQFENYIYQMKNSVEDKEKLADKIDDEDKSKIKDALSDAQDWLNAN